VHQLGECAWQWIRRLVMAPLCYHPENKKILFFQDEGMSPKLQQALQRVHFDELAQRAWR